MSSRQNSSKPVAEEPVRVLWGLNKIKGAWVVEKTTLQGGKVLDREAYEPELYGLAEERFQRIIRLWLSKR